MAFVRAAWWDVRATFDPEAFEAQLVAVDGKRLAKGRDFASDGRLRTTLAAPRRGRRARPRRAARRRGLRRPLVERKPYLRRPSAPFMTSTLQQEASRKLRFTSQRTMQVAQRLYENGYITYMRTDSTTLSEAALTAARAQARELYGPEYVPGAAAPVRAQGQERAGGARGDPSRRRHVPHAAAGRARARQRRASALRADLDADDRLADGRREGADGLPAASPATSSAGEEAEFGAVGHGHHLPRLPRRLRGGPRRRRGARRRRAQAARTSPRATP